MDPSKLLYTDIIRLVLQYIDPPCRVMTRLTCKTWSRARPKNKTHKTIRQIIKYNYLDILKYVIDTKISWARGLSAEKDIMTEAGLHNNPDIIQYGIQKKYSMSHALNSIMEKDHYESFLKYYNPKINSPSNVILLSSSSGSINIFKYIVGKYHGDIYFRYPEVWDFIFQNEHLHIATWFYNHGVAISNSAVVKALEQGILSAIRWLDLNFPSFINYNPITTSIQFKHFDVLEFLVERGYTDYLGITSISSQYGNLAVLDWLKAKNYLVLEYVNISNEDSRKWLLKNYNIG
jgi:hypothetical protein